MLKIRRSRDRLILNMGIPILVRRHLYIETAPCNWNLAENSYVVPNVLWYWVSFAVKSGEAMGSFEVNINVRLTNMLRDDILDNKGHDVIPAITVFFNRSASWVNINDQCTEWWLCINMSCCLAVQLDHGSLARYAKLRVAHAPVMPGTFSPPPRRSRHASRHVRHARAVMHADIAN